MCMCMHCDGDGDGTVQALNIEAVGHNCCVLEAYLLGI